MKAFSAIVVLVVLLLAAQSNAETTAYIPNQGDETITRVNTTDETFDSVALADSPYGAAVTPDGNYVFVTRSGSGQMNRVSADNFTNAGAQIEITVGTDPRGVAIEPEGDFAYVANFDDDTVSKVNVSSTSVAETITVGNGPLGVAAAYDQTDDTPLVYVTNNLGNSLTVIGENDETTTVSNICNGPAGVAVTPNGNFAYVACTDDDTVKVVRTSDNASIATISVGDAPWGVAVGSDGE